VAAFYNQVTDLIDMAVDPADSLYYSANLDEVSARGVEFQVDGQVTEKIRARASYTFTRTEDKATGEPLNNAPEHLGKLNLTVPVFRDWLFAGGEASTSASAPRWAARRSTAFGCSTPLYSAPTKGDWELSATVYNLFDKDYSDPSSGGLDAVEQDGRMLRLKAVFRFCSLLDAQSTSAALLRLRLEVLPCQLREEEHHGGRDRMQPKTSHMNSCWAPGGAVAAHHPSGVKQRPSPW
jgi:iron complex outermembrane receptor protein